MKASSTKENAGRNSNKFFHDSQNSSNSLDSQTSLRHMIAKKKNTTPKEQNRPETATSDSIKPVRANSFTVISRQEKPSTSSYDQKEKKNKKFSILRRIKRKIFKNKSKLKEKESTALAQSRSQEVHSHETPSVGSSSYSQRTSVYEESFPNFPNRKRYSIAFSSETETKHPLIFITKPSTASLPPTALSKKLSEKRSQAKLQASGIKSDEE